MPDGSSARDSALRVLGAWRDGRGRLDALVNDSFAKSTLDARDRRLVMELVYGVIRNLTDLDHILSHFVRETKKGVSPGIRDILRLAAYQLTRLDRVPAHAAVNEAVGQARRAEGPGAAGFVNAVLRALIRGISQVKYPDPGADPAGWLSIKYSHPAWLARRWLARFGFEGAQALMEAGNRVPPLTLRANTLVADRGSLISLLREKGVECSPGNYAPDSVIVRDGVAVFELPGYAGGLFAVQDEAAQLVSYLLPARPGETVLDACSAPGGKAAHIAALSKGQAHVFAMDINLDKLLIVKENIKRLKAGSVTPILGDAAEPLPVRGPFDGVLLDAPCSALGVIRRRPDIKYVRAESDIARLALVQTGMMDNLAKYVRPGGAFAYSVCSTEPDEGERVVEGFLNSHRDFVKDDIRPLLPPAAHPHITEEGYLRTLPHITGTDGFFAARMLKV